MRNISVHPSCPENVSHGSYGVSAAWYIGMFGYKVYPGSTQSLGYISDREFESEQDSGREKEDLSLEE
ncbi:hypothetical protein GJ496_009829 [Pomphorhynchus laevis]|nr:hypothetical protein GJ496_009829 [Pomphorhynchus laevis]